MIFQSASTKKFELVVLEVTQLSNILTITSHTK